MRKKELYVVISTSMNEYQEQHLLTTLHVLNTPDCEAITGQKLLSQSELLQCGCDVLNFCTFLIARGDLQNLRKLERYGYILNYQYHETDVVRSDNLQILGWWLDHYQPNMERFVLSACAEGSLTILDWYRLKELTFPIGMWHMAVRAKKVKVLAWLQVYVPFVSEGEYSFSRLLVLALARGDEVLKLISKDGSYDTADGFMIQDFQVFLDHIDWSNQNEFTLCIECMKENGIKLPKMNVRYKEYFIEDLRKRGL